MDGQKKTPSIVNVDGSKIHIEKKIEKVKFFIYENVWNLLGTGVATFITVVSLFRLIIANNYENACNRFYGVSSKYFDGADFFYSQFLNLMIFLIFISSPFLLVYLNRRLKSKLYKAYFFVITVFLFFMQILSYSRQIIDKIQYNWLKSLLDNYISVSIELIVVLIITSFVSIRIHSCKRKPLKLWEKIIYFISFVIYFFIVIMGFTLSSTSDVSDIKDYEIINNNKVIVSVYEGKFLTMNCKINDSELVIKKGEYSLVKMEDEKITYQEFQNVICK